MGFKEELRRFSMHLISFDSNKVSENYTVKGDKIRNDEILCRNKPIIRPINVQISIVDYLRLHREHGLSDPADVKILGCQKGQKGPD